MYWGQATLNLGFLLGWLLKYKQNFKSKTYDHLNISSWVNLIINASGTDCLHYNKSPIIWHCTHWKVKETSIFQVWLFILENGFNTVIKGNRVEFLWEQYQQETKIEMLMVTEREDCNVTGFSYLILWNKPPQTGN